MSSIHTEDMSVILNAVFVQFRIWSGIKNAIQTLAYYFRGEIQWVKSASA